MKSSNSLIDIRDTGLNWFPAEASPASLSAELVALLCDADSLTQHLIEISDESFRVELQQEEWLRVDSMQLRREFGPVAPEHKFWSRKTVLLSDEQPVVLAHSLLPQHASASALGEICQLGVQPLGAYLFRQPDLQRQSFLLAESSAGYWGRRSMFFTDHKPIMVAEFFIPGRKLDKLLTKIVGQHSTKVSNF